MKKNIKKKIINNKDKNLKDKIINLSHTQPLKFYDLIIVISDKLNNYRYNNRRIFPSVWNDKWVSIKIRNQKITGKTYFILLLLEENYVKISEILDYNFGIRKNDLIQVISDLSYIIRKTIEQVLNSYLNI